MRLLIALVLALFLALPAWATEQIANAVAPATSCTSATSTTTLAANLNGTDATDNITLASPPWPSSGTFSFQIDSEIMTATSCANSVCTSTRNEVGGEASHTAGAQICGPLLTARAVNQIKADLSGVRIGFSISGSPTNSQIFPVELADNITFLSNFGGAAPTGQSVASCGTPPTTTNTYNVTCGPNTPTLPNVYGGVSNNGASIVFTGLNVTAGQSVVIINKGTSIPNPLPSDGTNTYTRLPITTDGCLGLAYSLTPTPGTYTLTVPAPSPTANNSATVWLVNNLSAIDVVGGVSFGNTPAGFAQTGTVTPRTVNEVVIGEGYLEATTPVFTGSWANYAGTGTPSSVSLNTSLGTVISNAGQALAAVQEPGITASSAGIQIAYTGTTPNYCGAAIALLGQNVSIGNVTLTPTCVPTFSTSSSTQVCMAGQVLNLLAPNPVSGSNIAITLTGHL